MALLHDLQVISNTNAKPIHKIAPRPALSPFAAGHRELVDAGFSVLAIEPGTKRPGSYVRGHWGPAGGWTLYAENPAPSNVLANWCCAPNAGIGIALGSPAGEHDGVRYVTAVLDFDATDPELLAALLAAAPASPMVRVGKKGEARIYRAAPVITSTSFDIDGLRVLDVMAKGKQVVMPPTIHPVGMAYRWTDGSRIVPADTLPILTDGHMAALRGVLTAFGWCEGNGQPAATSPAGEAASDSCGDSGLRDLNDAALANLPAWVPDLGLHDCRPKRGGGYEAIAAWRASSGGRQLDQRARHLSIVSRGIVDFGDGPKNYTPIDVVMAACACNVGDAAHWLKERLGLILDADALLSPEAIERGLARSTAARAARDQAPIAPRTLAEATSVARNAATGALVAATNDNRRSDAEDEFPDDLTRPAGLLGEMTDYIVDTAKRPNRALALGAAITVLGTLIGRRDATPTESGTHLYVLALGPTGSGKQHPQDAGDKLMEVATADLEGDHVGSSEWMSQTALIKELKERPLCLNFVDEFGAFLAKVNNNNAGVHEQGIKKILLTAWGKSFTPFRTQAWAAIASSVIHSPALSVYGASTPARFFAALQGDDRENGFMNRLLLIPTYRSTPAIKPSYSFRDVPAELADQLAYVYQVRREPPEPPEPRERGDPPPPPPPPPPMHVVQWGEGAEAIVDAFAKEAEECEAKDFFVRSAEIAVRLATIVAVGREPDVPEVSVADVKWGIAVARWSATRLATAAGMYVGDTDVSRDRGKIMACIKAERGGRCRQTVVMQNCGFAAKQLRDLVADMVEIGFISIVDEPPPRGGRPVRWLVAA